MKKAMDLEVAVLLATYNGAPFVESQVRSLSENETKFTLHWLDDFSTDSTRDRVRAAALSANIPLREWHQSAHLGVPAVFFQLVESVEADIYLFCDQDDIWQPGKIDAAVADLAPHRLTPALSFSDPLMFRDGEPEILYRMSRVIGAKVEKSLRESRLFMHAVAPGNTQAFTRPLREIFMCHKEIARGYALVHDMWMFQIALASGTVRFLAGAPTTLFRRHPDSWSQGNGGWKGKRAGRIRIPWRNVQSLRIALSRNAKGFALASPTLPLPRNGEKMLKISRYVSTLDKRQSPASIMRLLCLGAMWPDKRLAAKFATACLLSDA